MKRLYLRESKTLIVVFTLVKNNIHAHLNLITLKMEKNIATSGVKSIAALILLMITEQPGSFAQQPLPSPKATAEGKNVKVTYGQPSKRDRVIFGGLVPYGEVWRTGANEATEITFSKDVIIDKKEIKAGTYTLFTIPNKDKWAIILNSQLKQWGAFGYEKIKNDDVLKTDVPVKKINQQEKLTYSFKDNATGTILTIAWDDVAVDLPIAFIY